MAQLHRDHGNRFPTTDLTLIERIGNSDDQVAWDEFVVRYGGVLRRWCASGGLQTADIDDVVQNILLELAQHVRNFSPTGRFRGWLKTVARRALYDFTCRRVLLDRAAGGSQVQTFLESVAMQEKFLSLLDREIQAELVEVAMQNVESKVSKRSWSAFKKMSLEGKSGQQIADELGMQVGSVYVANCQVKKLLQANVQRITEQPE